MLCEWIKVDGKGGNMLVTRIGRVRDALHLVWWMTNAMHFLFALALLAFVMQQCSLGSPKSSLKALTAYPDVKLMASFVYRC
jgi:hypothetical protein